MELPEWLEREYGGLPVWQWAAIVAAGVGLALVLRRSFPGAGGRDDAAPDGFVGDPTQGGFLGLQPTGGSYSPDGSGGIPLSQPPADDDAAALDDAAPRSNGAWLEAAFDAITPEFTAALADQSLRRYLQGRKLTAEQFAAVDAALAAVGPPPEGAPALELDGVTRDPGPTGPGDRAAPAPQPQPAPAPDRRPRGGFDYVRDNLGAEFVVNWSERLRFRVQPRDSADAAAIFDGPLTRSSQIPARARAAQRGLLDQLARDEGRKLSPDLIYLDQRMGWRDRGVWTDQGTRS